MSLNVALHKKYFTASLRHLPDAYSSLDTNRMTLAHFACHGLDLLGAWNEEEDPDNEESPRSPSSWRQSIIDWIYSLQVESGGFIGGHFLGEEVADVALSSAPGGTSPRSSYRHGHIAMSYTALTLLRLLGDDWSRLDRKALVRSLRELQLPDGSFRCVPGGSENDMRFLYCACCLSHMLDDWSAVDGEAAVRYVQSCRSFDGAMGLLPGQEGHGGSTFCAVASLALMNRLDDVLAVGNWRHELIHWCVSRQVGGLQGRPNKDEDTCYSYWIGGTLKLLGMDQVLDHDRLRSFVFRCQTKMGGFSKVIGVYPDLLHSYYSLAYLSLSQHHLDTLNLQDVNCTLGIGEETAQCFELVHP